MVVKRFLKVGEIFYINLEFITLYVETFYFLMKNAKYDKKPCEIM